MRLTCYFQSSNVSSLVLLSFVYFVNSISYILYFLQTRASLSFQGHPRFLLFYGSVTKLSRNRRKPYLTRVTLGWDTNEQSCRTITAAWRYCHTIYNMRVKDLRARHIKGVMEDGYIIPSRGKMPVKKYLPLLVPSQGSNPCSTLCWTMRSNMNL